MSNPSHKPHQKGHIRVGFYDIGKTIGKGNFAVVKQAKHRITKSRVALKIIDKSQLDQSDLKKTYREIDIMKKLSHPHVIRLYQVMETTNMLYLVTEHASNGELFDFLANRGRMKEVDARKTFWQIFSAVEYCHAKGIVHRDLKVENLLFDKFWNIKIADFGFSNFFAFGDLLDTWCGSPPYAAPEIFAGLKYDGEKLDIWSMGVILYVLVCGSLPFDGEYLSDLQQKVIAGRFRIPYFLSSKCENLIRKMLVTDPVKRYTMSQIKNHPWMQSDLELAHKYSAINVRSNYDNLDPLELNEMVLNVMNKLGVSPAKTQDSIKQQKFDNFYAIYYLLIERLKSSGQLSVEVQRSNVSFESNIVKRNTECTEPLEQEYQKKYAPGPSIDEGLGSDMSFESDITSGSSVFGSTNAVFTKEASLDSQMKPIQEDPTDESLDLSARDFMCGNKYVLSSIDSQVGSDYSVDIESILPDPAKNLRPPMQLIASTSSTNSSLDEGKDGFSNMLMSLSGHSNFSSLESQASEFSSNVSLGPSDISNNNYERRPPLVHQNSISNLVGRRASESNISLQSGSCNDVSTEPISHGLLKHHNAPLPNIHQTCLQEALANIPFYPNIAHLKNEVNHVNSAPGSPHVPKRTLPRSSCCREISPDPPSIASPCHLPHPEFLPKPHSFDESQCYYDKQNEVYVRADGVTVSALSDVYPKKQRSLDDREQQQPFEDPRGSSHGKLVKTRGIREASAPHHRQGQQSYSRLKSKRQTLQRQTTMNQAFPYRLERQVSETVCSDVHGESAQPNEVNTLFQQLNIGLQHPPQYPSPPLLSHHSNSSKTMGSIPRISLEDPNGSLKFPNSPLARELFTYSGQLMGETYDISPQSSPTHHPSNEETMDM